NPGLGMVRMRFKIPARGLLGYRSECLTDTRGTGIIHHRFFEYDLWAGALSGRNRGVMVADREGVVVAYALFNLQERGTMFVQPGDPVYEGMIIAEHVRPGDMDVNATKEKKLTNMRTTAADEMIMLEPPRQVTLELALEYAEVDEEFREFDKAKERDEDYDDELDEDEVDDDDLDEDDYDDLDDQFDEGEEDDFRPKKGPKREWE